MKILSAILIGVLILVGATLNTPHRNSSDLALNPSTELEIREIVLRHDIEQLERSHPGDSNICFVVFQKSDPTRFTKEGIPFPRTVTSSEPDAAFLSHFASAPRRVMSMSECIIIVDRYVHKVSRESGFVLCLGDVRRKSSTEVEAISGSVSPHSSTTRRYQVIRINGRWQVAKIIDEVISCG